MHMADYDETETGCDILRSLPGSWREVLHNEHQNVNRRAVAMNPIKDL